MIVLAHKTPTTNLLELILTQHIYNHWSSQTSQRDNQPKKTAGIPRRQHWFPREMASEETARKYSIPMTRYYPDDSDWSKRISLAARPIRSTAKMSLFLIWISKEDVKLERTTFCLVNIIDKLWYSSILPGNFNFNLFVCLFVFFIILTKLNFYTQKTR